MVISIVVIAFLGSEIICSVDNEIGSIDVISLNDSFEEFWVMNNTLLHEIDNDILRNSTHFLQVITLNSEFVLELPFLFQEFSVVSVIKVLLVWS